MSTKEVVVEPELVDGVGPSSGMGSEAGQLVAQGATLMRLENESMLAIAVQRPRNPRKVLAAALEELKIVPEEAKKAYYSIPYKEKQPDGSYKMVPVEGPSIKAAMALARVWGNCSTTARSLHEDAVGADLCGIFVDYETNFRVERPMRVSRVMKARRGGTWTLNPQQWLAAIQAGASKAIRNATLGGLPAWLVAAYMKQARIHAGGDPESKADPKKVASVLKAFERFNVTLEMLEKYVDEKKDDWMGDHLATLIGLGNAIADKQLTVAEAFELEAEAPAGPSAPSTATSGGITPEAVVAGTTAAQEGGPSGPPAPVATPPREPGADDDTPVVACTHPAVKRPVAKGKAVVCPDCTLEVKE